MSLGQIFKAVTNQRPEPWKEREATDALIEQLTDRVRELMEQNEALRKDAERYRWLRAGNYTHQIATSILNDTPFGIDNAVDSAMEAK